MDIREDRLAEHIGFARQVLIDLRREHLCRGEDWGKEGCRVVLTPSGVRKVQEILGVRVEVKFGEYEEMAVERAGMVNPRIVVCLRDNGEKVYVRVNDSKNFQRIGNNGKPMKLKARFTKDGWFLEGRCPRYPGRW